MKIYAEYYTENGLEFRRNTLLQFGDSWELIGNIVLANPGSAEPISKPDGEAISHISSFFETYREANQFKEENWKQFSADTTMGIIEKLFRGDYVDDTKTLNGVIQLFNTFYIKNQNLEEAITQIGVDSDLLFSYGIEKYFHDKPTYFGFGNEVLNNITLRKVAENIFDGTSEIIKQAYNSDFSQNSFYHPMYINRAYKQQNFEKYKDSVLKPLINNL